MAFRYGDRQQTAIFAIFERYQTKTIRLIAKAPWYITNRQIHKDLQVPTVQKEIKRFDKSYIERLINHCNPRARMVHPEDF